MRYRSWALEPGMRQALWSVRALHITHYPSRLFGEPDAPFPGRLGRRRQFADRVEHDFELRVVRKPVMGNESWVMRNTRYRLPITTL